LCATGYSLVSEPGMPINDVPAIDPEKTNVSFVPSDGSAELKLLVNGEPEQVDEVSPNLITPQRFRKCCWLLIS
jgi:glutamate N-acetyltransferase / amino-acid N-acetyltransferase